MGIIRKAIPGVIKKPISGAIEKESAPITVSDIFAIDSNWDIGDGWDFTTFENLYQDNVLTSPVTAAGQQVRKAVGWRGSMTLTRGTANCTTSQVGYVGFTSSINGGMSVAVGSPKSVIVGFRLENLTSTGTFHNYCGCSTNGLYAGMHTSGYYRSSLTGSVANSAASYNDDGDGLQHTTIHYGRMADNAVKMYRDGALIINTTYASDLLASGTWQLHGITSSTAAQFNANIKKVIFMGASTDATISDELIEAITEWLEA